MIFLFHPSSLILHPFVLAVGVGLTIALVTVVARQSHRKAARGDFELMGCIASVEKPLEPEGSILVHGELWCARSRTNESVARGRCNVRIVGARGHWLLVESVK